MCYTRRGSALRSPRGTLRPTLYRALREASTGPDGTPRGTRTAWRMQTSARVRVGELEQHGFAPASPRDPLGGSSPNPHVLPSPRACLMMATVMIAGVPLARLIGGLLLAVIAADLWPDGAITGADFLRDVLVFIVPGLVAMWAGAKIGRRR